MSSIVLAIAGCPGGGGGGNSGGSNTGTNDNSGGNTDNSNDQTANQPFPPSIDLMLTASGFSRPTDIENAGDGSGRLFIVEKSGRIRIIKNGTTLATPFLDISSKVQTSGEEQGLLGLAFPPRYAEKGYFYVDYTATAGDGDSVLARYRIGSDPDVADPASEQVILTVDQPFGNHNGGRLVFGPDGYLYVGMGDGGGSGDPYGHGQDTSVLFGKILRIDVEADPNLAGYGIPTNNPLVGRASAREEIWALGLRNPWRFSFDRVTGDLYIADVGQNSTEEIDYQPAASGGGENYGWSVMEGSECFKSSSCDKAGLVLPVAEYDHSSGDCSVTGGAVYRGQGFPDLQGIYFYGDFCSGIVRALRKNSGRFESDVVLNTGAGITSFGEDETGELYVADFTNGDIYRLVEQQGGP